MECPLPLVVPVEKALVSVHKVVGEDAPGAVSVTVTDDAGGVPVTPGNKALELEAATVTV